MARGLLRFPAPDCIACNTTGRGEPEANLLFKRRCVPPRGTEEQRLGRPGAPVLVENLGLNIFRSPGQPSDVNTVEALRCGCLPCQ
jgi:hypothetical protein